MTHSCASYSDVIDLYESMNGFELVYESVKYKIIFEYQKSGFSFDAKFKRLTENSLGIPYYETLFCPLLDQDDFELLNIAIKKFKKHVDNSAKIA